MFYKIIYGLFVWSGSKLFNHLVITVYPDNEDEIRGMAFGKDEGYVNHIEKL